MEAYAYNAAIYCADCAEKIKKDLNKDAWEGKIPEVNIPADPTDESTFDSDDYPKGPYEMDREESDSPQHCDECGVFLENDLTREGVDYVIEAVRKDRKAREKGQKPNPTVQEWENYYDLDYGGDEDDEEER